MRDFYRTWFAPPPYVTGDHSALYRDSGAAVVMFSTSTCPYCRQAHALLTRRGVTFREYVIDRSRDAEQRFDDVRGRSVPLLFIGERRIVGFREDAIVEALNRLPAPTPLAAR